MLKTLSKMWRTRFGSRGTIITGANINDEGILEALIAGTETDSGVTVNKKKALQYSPFWRGVNLISRDVGKLPLFVYQRDGSGKRRAIEHPAFRLLRRKPNAEMTAFTFRETLQSHALTRGNGYAYIDRRGDGAPSQLILLNPDNTYPVRANGTLWYVVDVRGDQRKITAQDILHIRGLGDDGLIGYDVISYAKNSLGRGIGAAEYTSRYFKNDGTPGMVLEYPGTLSPEAFRKLKAEWSAMHSGLENKHKTAILENGMKLNQYSVRAKDTQLIETRTFELREVANWLGIPPHKLGDTARTSYNSLEQENQSYLDDALDPWLVKWEEECWDKLLTEDEKRNDTHVVEFLRNALVRADLAARGNFYHQGLQDGWFNRDEVRAMENMNPMPDGIGQKYYIPLNMGVASNENPDEIAFKRKLVEALLNRADTGDVIYNLTRVERLLDQVGITREQKIKAPFMPVYSQTGEPVSGDVLKDPNGYVVGGKTIEASPPDVQPANPSDPPPAAPEETKNESDPMRAATRVVLTEALHRAAKRITTGAKRLAKRDDGELQRWLQDGIVSDNRTGLIEMLSPAVAVATACGIHLDSTEIADACIALAVESCGADWTKYETQLPATIVSRFIPERTNGTPNLQN